MFSLCKKFASSTSKRCFSTLFVAEHNNQKLFASNFNGITAALQLKDKIDVLVAGSKVDAVVEQIQKTFPADHINKIIVYDHPALEYQLHDTMDHVINKAIADNKYTHVLMTSTTFGKDLLPRVAAQNDSQAITDITEITGPDSFVRASYASNAMTSVKSSDKIKFISARSTNFDKYAGAGGNISNVEKQDFEPIFKGLDQSKLTKFVSQELVAGDKPELTSAKNVVAGGRAMKSAENFKLLDDLAGALGNCAVGASRAAVDAGYAPNDYQVGQTGKVVAPDLYFAIGISGAIQHLAGMKDSKVIVAINKDPEATIFSVANYGLVGDLFKIIPELTEKLKAAK
jgi:electron transfer flavoprotein alpha subunit